ncbi:MULTISPECIES: endonuclease/exonuclease/phosphatase family protein [Thiorhodovibrio]|uniref:endonuclease/exonuclease/phosphatase family protein n=1 Tax=Thiorhodovibrio TaxID=61593 RepID=UPI0019144924|nr:endonuclease/exonuclease/phosphatase family protein [Thiorhodovibrio litoralis]WPL13851.1 Endonuclease/Exonuclease/phosphatase family protein [Thiorhodovibrio litoralis]
MAQRWGVIVVIIAVLCVAGSAPEGHSPAAQDDARPAATLTAMTFNVGDPSRQGFPVDTLAECILRDGRPDILLLQEASGCRAAMQLPARLGYHHSLAASADSIRGSGLCVLTNLPIIGSNEYTLPDEGKWAGALCAVLDHQGRKVRACSVHLDANWSDMRAADGRFELTIREWAKILWAEFFAPTSRYLAARELVERLQLDSALPTLLGGDFNTVPWSYPIRTINRSFRDASWLTRSYLEGTYHKLPGPLQPRIDFVFVSPSLQSTQAEVVQCPTGDHYPVRANVRLSGEPLH